MIEGRLGNPVLCSSLRIPIHYLPRTCGLCRYHLVLTDRPSYHISPHLEVSITSTFAAELSPLPPSPLTCSARRGAVSLFLVFEATQVSNVPIVRWPSTSQIASLAPANSNYMLATKCSNIFQISFQLPNLKFQDPTPLPTQGSPQLAPRRPRPPIGSDTAAHIAPNVSGELRGNQQLCGSSSEPRFSLPPPIPEANTRAGAAGRKTL